MIDPTQFDNEHMRSALIEALERLTTTFWGPTPEICGEMLDGTFWAPFEALAPLLNCDTPDAVARLKEMCAVPKTSPQLTEQLEAEYVAAFVNRYGGIRASLYASSYHGNDTTLMAEPARLMEKRFAAKGLQMAADRNEPADHLAIQLEFCYFLLKQENSGEAFREAVQFTKEAMLPWVTRLHERLAADGSEDFYALTTTFLAALLRWITQIPLSSIPAD